MKTPHIPHRHVGLLLSFVFLLAACAPQPAAITLAPVADAGDPALVQPALRLETATPVSSQTSAPAPSPVPFTPTVEMAARLPLPPADEASARLRVPDGFAVRIYAENLAGKPRFMAFGPDGALYLSLLRGGAILRLADDDHDGKAEDVRPAASGFNQPHGLAWRDGWLYVAENDRVSRLKSSQNDGVLDVRETVTGNIPGGGGHVTRTLGFGPDGKLYVSAGSSCNVCAETDPRRAAILRFNPDGSIPEDNPFAGDTDQRRRPLWAWGLRNSVDFLWTPAREMWANGNGRDNLLNEQGLPDTLPPEFIVAQIKRGGFYGWPYCYPAVLGLDTASNPQVLDRQSGLALPQGLDCAQAVPPLFTAPAHSAPLGMSLASAGNFPVDYLPDLYVAYHGSWNVQNPANIRDCKVERIVIEDGLPVRAEPFASGWRAEGKACGDPSAYGRPADVVFGPDGAMYISDDAGGRVYRVIYTPGG